MAQAMVLLSLDTNYSTKAYTYQLSQSSFKMKLLLILTLFGMANSELLLEVYTDSAASGSNLNTKSDGGFGFSKGFWRPTYLKSLICDHEFK
jgi:hypothetical protein